MIFCLQSYKKISKPPNFILKNNSGFLTKVIKTAETGNPLPWPHRHSPELGGCPCPLRSHAVESLLQPRGKNQDVKT